MKNTNDIELTQPNTAGAVRIDDQYDDTTADLNDYLFRDGGIQSEWDAANRLWELRKVALELLNELRALDIEPKVAHLRILDVEISETVKKRVSLHER